MIEIQAGIIDITDNICGLRIRSQSRGHGLSITAEQEGSLTLPKFHLGMDAVIQLIEFLTDELAHGNQKMRELREGADVG